MITTPALAVQACAAFLSCAAHNGINPEYIHSLKMAPDRPDAQVIYDGTANDAVIDGLKACVPDMRGKRLQCSFHQEKP